MRQIQIQACRLQSSELFTVTRQVAPLNRARGGAKSAIVDCLVIMVALCNRGAIIFLPCGFFLSSIYLLSFFFSSPDLSGHRLDVYHTSTHGAALVRI